MTASDPERSILPSRVDAAAGAARVARYAEALGVVSYHATTREYRGHVDAVMAVADDELDAQAKTRVSGHEGTIVKQHRRITELEAEVERLLTVQARLDTEVDRHAALVVEQQAVHDALVSDLRWLAYEKRYVDPEDREAGIYLAGQQSTQTRLRAVLDKHAGEHEQGGEGS